jgi:F0F1-type ATP synthase assembly protein I
MHASARKRAKNVMLAPAMVSVLAYLSFLVPLLNIAAPGILGAMAIWSAVGGIRLHGELGRRKDNDGVSKDLRSGLLVMSILTIVFASIPLLLQIFAWVALALSRSHARFDY